MKEQEFLKYKKWAVIGAHVRHDRYGYKIYKKLKEKGYEVYPINPRFDEIEGDKCYKDLSSIPVKIDVIDMVVNPKRGIPIIEEAAKLGINKVWFQPGTVDDDILKLAKEKGIDIVQACVLVATNYI